MITKQCRKCLVDKPVTEFGEDINVRDGFRTQCKDCRREAKNAAARRAYQRDPDRIKAFVRRYEAEHGETLSVYRAAWRRDNSARIVARVRRWAEEHPEQYQTQCRIAAAWRRARLSALILPFTSAQLAARMSMFGNHCYMCGGPFEHIDHVKPLAAGGPHILANRPACASCNIRKGRTWGGAACVG